MYIFHVIWTAITENKLSVIVNVILFYFLELSCFLQSLKQIFKQIIDLLITSLAKEVMFLVALVSLSVCLWTTLLKTL